jgi:hypothetical protein
VEHHERQDEREQEIRADADQLDEQGKRMDEGTDQLGEKIDEAREDLESKQQAGDVPGLQPEGDENADNPEAQAPNEGDDEPRSRLEEDE